MTDLMFLLLVFLLISTTLVNPNALKLILPQSSNHVKEKAYTSVSITPDLKYYVELTPVAFDEIEPALQAAMQGVEDPVVSLHVDETVPTGEMVKVMNIINRNKYTLILATRPE